MTTIWYFTDEDEQWRTNPLWQDRKESIAHEISDRYNSKYEGRYYWVSESKPGEEERKHIKEATHDAIST